MQGKQLYEYAVIRVVPKIEREEFVNIGIILFSKKANFIDLLYTLDKSRLCFFDKEIDVELLKASMESFDKIARGNKEGGKIAGLEIPERFRWLTAVRSTCIQTSRPHSGFSDDLQKTTEKLFHDLVL